MEEGHSDHVAIARLDEARLPRTVWSLAWPAALGETSYVFGDLVVTFLVGRLGAASVTAVGLAEQALWLPDTVFFAITIGTTAVLARHVGAERYEQANVTLRQSMIMATAFGVLFTVLAWVFAAPVLRLFQAQPEVVPLGRNYLRVVSLSTVPVMLWIAGEASLRGAGNTRTPMLVIVTATVLRAVLAYVLIYGRLGAPAMGVPGAALATVISNTVGGFIIVIILVRGSGVLKYDLRRCLAWDKAEVGRIMKIGTPAVGEQLQMQLGMTVYGIAVASLGTQAYAAHSLAVRVESVAFMPGWGFGGAATILVGQSLGAGHPDIGERSAYLARLFAVASMVFLGLLMFAFSTPLMAYLIDDAEVVRLGAMYLKLWLLAMPMMATGTTLAGGLRGAGDTRWVLWISSVCIWGVRIPLGYALAIAGNLGVWTVWAAAVVDWNLRGILFWWRFARGRWKTLQV